MRKRSLTGLLAVALMVLLAGCWPMPNRISVSPDGLIALTMPDGTDGLYKAFPVSGHIWLVDPATGRAQTILTAGENLSWATFSPDGHELLYIEGPSIDLQQILSQERTLSHPWRLMLFHRQNSTQTELLTGDHGFIWGPTFSPDGRKIAYYRGDGENRLGLYIFDRNTQQEKVLKLMQDAQGVYYAPYGPGPLWAPDGEWLFVIRVEEILPHPVLPRPHEITPETVRIFSGRLGTASIDCGCEQTILRGFFPLLPTPLYVIASRDGQRLYMNGYDQTFSISAQQTAHLYEVTLETGDQAALYDEEGIALAPVLSPDEGHLVFTVISPEKTPKADLYLLNLRSLAPPRRLTDDGRSGFAFWVSDRDLGFLRLANTDTPSGEIWIKNLDTGQERNLSPLLSAQQSVTNLSVQLAKLSKEKQAYQDEIAASRQTLERVQHQLQILTEQMAPLSDTLEGLSHRLDAVQTQSLEMSDQANQRLTEMTQQINVLLADVGTLTAQITELETGVKAGRARSALSLWELVIALLVAAVFIIWMIRRALGTLTQQLAFPPQ
jgi:Tol biopolymer transport system component